MIGCDLFPGVKRGHLNLAPISYPASVSDI